MRLSSLRLTGLAALLVIAGCGDRGTPTSPVNATVTAARTILSSPQTVTVVRRNTPLATSISTSAVVGVFGGTLSLPGAGLVVVIPPFAVSTPTRITITALAGSQVAYEFEPHGTRFLTPLVVTQNLNGTSAVSGGLFTKPVIAGYFANLTDLDPLANTGAISELLGVSLNTLTRTATFPIFHFSGYLVATGETASDETAQ